MLEKRVARTSEWITCQWGQVWHSATQRVMSLTALGMLMSLLVDVLIAARLGTSSVADALIIALSLPRLVDTVVREGTKFSLMALFVEKHNTLPEDEYRNFVSGLLNLFLVAGLGLTILGWLLAPEVVARVGPGLTSADRAQASLLFRLSMPLTLFALASTILGGLLNSQRHFVPVSARNAVGSTVAILAIGLSRNSSQVPAWIAGAYTLGYGLFFGLLLWYSAIRIGFRPNWRTWPDCGALRQLWQAFIYPILGFGARQGSRVVERTLASLVAIGGVSAYYFAFRLVSAVQTIVGVSIATTGLPGITRHDLAGERDKFNQALRQRAVSAILLGLLVAIVVIVFHGQIVHLLYGRGAFGADSVQKTGQVLLYLGGGLILRCLVPVLSSGLYAQRRYSWILFNMTLVATVNVFLAWLLSRSWGLVGIAVAVTASALVSAINLIFLLRRSGVWLGFDHRDAA